MYLVTYTGKNPINIPQVLWENNAVFDQDGVAWEPEGVTTHRLSEAAWNRLPSFQNIDDFSLVGTEE